MVRADKKREPDGVPELRERIDLWRRTRPKPGRMPEELWSAAGKSARKHGLNPIASALRLDYYSLKERADGVVQGRGPKAGGIKPAFVEVRPAGAPSGCVLEIEEPGGA